MGVTAMKSKNAVESLREIVQDLPVPELKSIKVSIDSLHTERQLRDEKQTQAVQYVSQKFDQSVQQLSQKIDSVDEKQTQAVQHLSQKLDQSFQQLSQKIDLALDIRERIIALEARQATK